MRVSVLGAGSWGTALGNHLSKVGHEVTFWDRDATVLHSIETDRINQRFFPQIKLAEGLRTKAKLEDALQSAEAVVFALPSSGYREAARVAAKGVSAGMLVVSAAKGLEKSTLYLMSDVLEQELGVPARLSVLSGPTFAREVLLGYPTAATVAATSSETAKRVAALFHRGTFRIYTSDDLIGVQLGGVVKNVIALAAGVVDGSGMGMNARAALITRGLVEMQRLVNAMGGKSATIMGLSGLGDLLLTATGDLSRNRQVGLRLARGEKLENIVRDLGQCAEGVENAGHLLQLAQGKGVEMPIVEEVAEFLSGRRSVEEGLTRLLSRPGREEA